MSTRRRHGKLILCSCCDNVEITQQAGKCLQENYIKSLYLLLSLIFGSPLSFQIVFFSWDQVNEPSSTPRRRAFNLPSVASIEELKT
ncbi:hypothetical protein AMTRI_Chr10g7430 [Amborella trichopoda]